MHNTERDCWETKLTCQKNRTKQAMWELDSIFRSNLYLEIGGRFVAQENMQRALNRGEAYHKLRRAISHENSGKFRVETESEQNLERMLKAGC